MMNICVDESLVAPRRVARQECTAPCGSCDPDNLDVATGARLVAEDFRRQRKLPEDSDVSDKVTFKGWRISGSGNGPKTVTLLYLLWT